MKRKATMRDVAAAANVGVMTVSRVVNGDQRVTEERRRRVHAAIKELGFQPNATARALRPGQRTATIALIIEDVSNPFYSAVAHGAEEVARRHQHLVIVSATRRDWKTERDLVTEMVRRSVDGLLIVPAPHDHTELDIAQSTPVVYLDRVPDGIEADSVVLPNESGAREAVGWLLGRGHTRIAYLGGHPDVRSGAGRLGGYRRALCDAGLTERPELIRSNLHSAEQAADAVQELLVSERPPTAIFSDNNRMSVGVLHALEKSGQTVEVAGFDDVELASLVRTPLLLVTHDAVELGRQATTLLFERMNGLSTPPQTITLPAVVNVYNG
ncbi:LacI family DNA-binding transcriptional regulator [Streptomyces sp. NPDC088747]|uniref:LacI family DNA-binding transcriptional regulator n=1 Tax=Streptomyces sp. NPDC088747 TaxID=3365886 RepID=UPI003824A4EB